MSDLISWDKELFSLINGEIVNSYLDLLMPLMRNPFVWAPVYVFFAAFFVYNFRAKGFYILIFGLCTFILSDQISSHVLKDLIQRLRPCNDPEVAAISRLLIPCGSGFSFPSTHASNHFAFSVFLISVVPLRMKWVLPFTIVWASMVAYAQVYVGVHYPLDAVAGALLGCIIGSIMGILCVKSLRLNLDRTEDEDEIIDNEPAE